MASDLQSCSYRWSQLTRRHFPLEYRLVLIRFVSAAALVLPLRLLGQATATNDSLLWSWFGTCAHVVRMAIEVRVDGQLLHKSAVPLCHLRRADIQERQYRAMVRFRFAGGRTFQDEYRTTRADTIEGNIWQAGADPDRVILGVSFMTEHQELLNTLYMLVPGVSATDTLDRGITVRSYPITLQQLKRHQP